MSRALYLDASAFVKIFLPEPESAAVAAAAVSAPLISSDLLVVEGLRAAHRAGGDAPRRARAELESVLLVPFDEGIRDAAAALEPGNLSSLDAIHVATAAALEGEIDALVTYDQRMASAADALGIMVVAPA